MKVKHIVAIGLIVVGGLYVLHMTTSHQGQSLLSGLGVNAVKS